jgi:multisubunit Na+/H+ antiporter MnhB subunit
MVPYLIDAYLIGITIIVAIMIYKWHMNDSNSFNLSDALKDSVSGKASLFRIGQAVALVSSTWGLVALIQRGTLTELYFTTYMGIWSGANVINNIFGKKTTEVAKDDSTSKT